MKTNWANHDSPKSYNRLSYSQLVTQAYQDSHQWLTFSYLKDLCHSDIHCYFHGAKIYGPAHNISKHIACAQKPSLIAFADVFSETRGLIWSNSSSASTLFSSFAQDRPSHLSLTMRLLPNPHVLAHRLFALAKLSRLYYHRQTIRLNDFAET